MAQWQLPPEMVLWITSMAGVLHARLNARLLALFVGVLFARGRRTVASWLRGGGLQKDFKKYYYFLGSLGRNSRSVARVVLSKAMSLVAKDERVLLALDDSPTERYGPFVEGAGIHHNPTPGPAEQTFVYGHVWVTLALIAQHGMWGTIALPLQALLYVRRKDIGPLATLYRISFRTKLELAAELLEWAAAQLKDRGRSVWVVADGAYAKRPFLQRARQADVKVVSRLRKDAALSSLPKSKQPGQRGPQATYGKEAIDLAKRAGHKKGWQMDTFTLYGKEQRKKYKTFLATYRPAGGLIRVVLVKEARGWVAFFCTDAEASVADILEAVADRAALEQVFHDIKEVHGAGQQQLRNYWANIAAFNMILWLHTLVELWAWDKSHEELTDRSDSPWDDPTRRPSHADRCKALRRECLQKELPHTQVLGPDMERFQQLWSQLLSMAV